MKSGIERLEPAGRHQEGSHLAVGVLVGEQVHEAAGLLEGRPEDHDEGEDHEDHAQSLALDLRERLLLAARHPERSLGSRLAADVADVTLREGELDDHGQQHADARGEEAGAPAVGRVLAERRADERREERADVDAHVEDDEGTVAARVALRVEVAHHGRDVRLEEAVADAHEHEAEVEAGRRIRKGDAERGQGKGTRGAQCVERCREHELPCSHDETAEDHGLALAEPVVGDPAAEDRGAVDEPQVPAVELQRLRVRPAEAGIHRVRRGRRVQHEERAHAVEAEALPHLRGEQEVEALRMTEEGPLRNVQVLLAHADCALAGVGRVSAMLRCNIKPDLPRHPVTWRAPAPGTSTCPPRRARTSAAPSASARPDQAASGRPR